MRYAFGPKQDYDGALSYVESQLTPGDQIVTISIASSVYNDFYKTGWVTLTSGSIRRTSLENRSYLADLYFSRSVFSSLS